MAALAFLLLPLPADALSRWLVHQNGSGVTDSNISVEAATTNYGSGVTATCRRVLGFEMRCLFRFDLSVFMPADATRVLDAQLNLYPYTNATPWWLESYRVTEEWVESEVTWNDRKAGTAWGAAGGSFAAGVLGRQQFTAPIRANISVADAVIGHFNGTYQNYGFLLRNTSGGTNIGEFLTKNYFSSIGKPWLYVLYVARPANPTNFHVAASDYSLNWTWTNPADPDFSTVEVWVNGTLNATTTGGYFLHGGLDPFNCRGVGLRSVNTYGDRNASFINRTDCTTNTLPPGPVSNIQAASGDWHFAVWSWTNPPDSDFAGTDVFVDGAFAASLGAQAASYNASGFLQNTTHSITVRSRDNGSNIGQNITGLNTTPRCEAWTCTPYEVCPVGGTHSRSCTDARDCGTSAYRPESESACVPPDLTRIGTGNVTGFFSGLQSALDNLSQIDFFNATPSTSISELLALPSGVASLEGEAPYIINITTTGPAGDDSLLHLNLKRSFVDSRGLDPFQVKFFAHNASNNLWQPVETIHMPAPTNPVLSRVHRVPADAYHYHVIPSHFSLFAPQMGGALSVPPPAPGGGESGNVLNIPSPVPSLAPAGPAPPAGLYAMPIAAIVVAVALLSVSIWVFSTYRFVRK